MCWVAGTWVTFGSQISDQVSREQSSFTLDQSGPTASSIPEWIDDGFQTGNPQRVSLQVAEDVMTVAYDNGINLFDTAEVYSAGR